MISVHHGMVYLHHELGKFLDDAKYYLSAYPNRNNCDVYEKDYDSDSKVTRHLKKFLENIIIITRNIRIFLHRK